MSKSVLFVCTGNYYRSRFSEYYFNHLALQNGLALSAYSKGLDIYNNNNVGPMAKEAKDFLAELNVPIPTPLRFPEPLVLEDFDQYDDIIILDEEEHLPMMLKQFPNHIDQVQFWGFPDVHLMKAEDMLPKLKVQVAFYLSEKANA